jgi:hypothetical protein
LGNPYSFKFKRLDEICGIAISPPEGPNYST